MKTKTLLDYEIVDIGMNCKCVVKCLGKPIFVFNCLTQYEDRAEETIQEVFELAFKYILTKACEEKGCTIHNASEYPEVEQMTRYNRTEMDFSTGMPICPECKNHEQGEPMEVHDCKNVYYDIAPDGKMDVKGQCCCYSKEHGIRED